MLKRLLPERFDNHYRGHPGAIWLMGVFTIASLAIGLLAIVSADSGAQSADGIPLYSLTVGGASTIIAVVALLGLAAFLRGVLCGLVLMRYRSMLPLMYLLVATSFLARQAIGLYKPIATDGVNSSETVTLVLTVFSVVGLVLSLVGKGYRSTPSGSA